LLIFGPERPATDGLNLRRNSSKKRRPPARFGRYFDFFAAADPKRAQLFMVNFHLLVPILQCNEWNLSPQIKAFHTVGKRRKATATEGRSGPGAVNQQLTGA
jgi:hypothetical protein